MKFSRRGMIKIRMPAIKATMAGTCVVVMTIITPVMRGESLRGHHCISPRVPKEETRQSLLSSAVHKNCPKMPRLGSSVPRNDVLHAALGCGASAGARHDQH